ncbi:E3 ubiquitin-protein ligase BRE1-like 1 [Histomonas meleagridis]|uniref:E3 ubiquitin-protein ligase BRE1-like 1 n=1 Tax=Histomonas meleagridis TaxID=135588 RepID=UPI00355A5310|nr:E3 ubiquitin-protein ligase BRE1-like 1 [Histomonas meleagridis]KAH0800658.1 E3 ubiquitin-protein ligase BRE1-like 1 [Histomonas meleagridis]
MSLNIFPSSFPHHVIAYSQALCNIIDIQRHLVFSKATLQSQIELFEIQNSSPSPKIIQQFPEFQKHVRLQNELLKHTAYLSNHIHNDFQNISKLCEQISSDRSTLIQLIQVDFTNNREGMLQYLDALVSFDLFIRHNKFVKILSTHFDPFKFTPRDYSKRLSDLSLQLQNSNLTEKQAVLTETIQIRDSIKSDIAICQEKLNELNQRLIASPIQNANMNTSRSQQNAINHFRDMINAFRQITDVSIECINSIQTIETASSIFSKQFGALNYKDLTLLSTVYHSSLNYFELLSESMKKKIEEKEQINSEILEQIYQCRAETDRIKMVAKSLRKKRKTPEIICNECEKCRKFVISRCGHSFCNSCIDKIYDERLFVCPACGTEFSEGDIIRINWK